MSKSLVDRIKTQVVALGGANFYVTETPRQIEDQAAKAQLVTVNVVTWQQPPTVIKTVLNIQNVLALHEATDDVIEQRNEHVLAMEAQRNAMAQQMGQQQRGAPIVPMRG